MIFSPVALAWLWDLALGDPEWRWHPVRIMGRVIAWADRRLPHSRLAGVGLLVFLSASSWFFGWALLRLAGNWAWLAETVLVFFCLAGRDMLDHARSVLKALETGDLKEARIRVARIVGRDTGELDSQGVCRATLESVAESFNDGLLAPLFFAYLGGAPLALAYKAVSTLDSMIGYKNSRYAEFGWASARLDDLLNFVPARLSALLIAIASRRSMAALSCAWKDGPKQPSPNSGWPEGAFAGALGIQLGGPVAYKGVISNKALLGIPDFALGPSSVRAALGLFMGASALSLTIGEILWHWFRA